jgi:DNA-binding response OmpR family regulator
MRILLIEDEIKVASFIRQGLMEQSLDVDIGYDGETALNQLRAYEYDLIILDIMLPDKDGITLCREFRTINEEVPILMLTALGSIDDKIKGFAAGADDYLLKPFHFNELLARIHALTRRRRNIVDKNILTFDDLEMNISTKVVKRGNNKIILTAKEFSLLELFLLNAGKVLSRNYIAETVWGIDFNTGTNIIDVYINYLRNKIEKGFKDRLIYTVIGMGYVLRKGQDN